MIKLEKSEVLGRKTRRDDPAELSIPDFDVAREAIKAGDTKRALDFVEYARDQAKRNNDSYAVIMDVLATYLARFGEEEVNKVFKERYYPLRREWLATTHGALEALQSCTESQRRHQGNFTIKEEPDRYVVTYDPCGSGGRLRRNRPVGTTKKAYDWSWRKAGVPYYCCHCCINWEIIPIEIRGYPVRVHLFGDKPGDPCVHLFYKKPELIPEEYFTRVGKKKDPSKFKD